MPKNNSVIPQNRYNCISVCDEQPTVAAISGPKCFFCGNQSHDRPRRPARNSICENCKKKGHFARVCRSHTAAATNHGKSLLASSTLNFSVSLSRSSLCGEIKGEPVKILVDTGSSENFIHPDKVVEKRKISYFGLARNLIRHLISPNQDDLSYSPRTFISDHQIG